MSSVLLQAKALKVLRRQMRHVLFTEPSDPQAGQELTVFYNPNNTGLNGCPEIYITVSACASTASVSTPLYHCHVPGPAFKIVMYALLQCCWICISYGRSQAVTLSNIHM